MEVAVYVCEVCERCIAVLCHTIAKLLELGGAPHISLGIDVGRQRRGQSKWRGTCTK